ncbi:hypothetical protein OHB12_06140 [Nocardia sp. NBC_01730]|uniref:hypothetical protein n=1 Tax=Nocardia sp. NBC_01730 TaxID=2975998 RepID=UPI002E12B4DE|nr:hypothetical protein OHB12_06140 [Nocardia sp. NBC_01730]
MSNATPVVPAETAADRCALLRSEIAAFYAGFGQPEALRAAFSDAVVVVALTGDDRLLVSEFGRVDWLLAFTSVDEFAHYMTARGVAPGSEYRYHTLLGRRIVDEFTARCARPTGVAIDIAGVAPIAFPPTPPGGWGVG